MSSSYQSSKSAKDSLQYVNVDSSISSCGSRISAKTAKKIILQYDLDTSKFSEEDLEILTLEMFRFFDVFNNGILEETSTLNFIRHVRTLYNPNNTFHNFNHAISVSHLSFQLLYRGAEKYFDSKGAIALLVAGLCHDIGHRGNNNAFEEETNSEIYNSSKVNGNKIGSIRNMRTSNSFESLDKMNNENLISVDKLSCLSSESFLTVDTTSSPQLSPSRKVSSKDSGDTTVSQELLEKSGILEIHHASVTQSLLMSRESNIDLLKNFSDTERVDFVEKVIVAILGTDMKKHGDIIEDCNEFLKDNEGISVDSLSDEAKTTLLRILLHSADLGAQTQSHQVAYQWMKRCYDEYVNQANKEKKLGIQTSSFIHELDEQLAQITSQCGFIKNIVEPLWLALLKILPDLKFACDQLHENFIAYEKEAEQCGSKIP